MSRLDRLCQDFETALLRIDRTRASEILEQCRTEDNPMLALETVVTRALERIGLGWEDGAVSLAQVYMSGVICEHAMEPFLKNADWRIENAPVIGMGVLLDQHGLGKRIVSSMLESVGYEIIDLGLGLSPEEMAAFAIEHRLDVLLISTLMLSSALKVSEVKALLVSAGSDTKVVVGGAPFRLDESLWRKVGADATAKSASVAIKILEKVLTP